VPVHRLLCRHFDAGRVVRGYCGKELLPLISRDMVNLLADSHESRDHSYRCEVSMYVKAQQF
jgi:hypothetical protein